MKRPLLLNSLPDALAGRIYYRFYRPVPSRFSPLYRNAPLRYAPNTRIALPKSKEYMYDLIALTGVYEPHLTRRVQTLARSGGVLVDVGANVGYFTLVWGANNPANRVIAVEPAPLVTPYLRQNLHTNGLCQRVRLFPCAASNVDGVARFSSVVDEPTGWARFTDDGRSPTGYEVETRTLDRIVGLDTTVTLLKIDVEGAESLVLAGAKNLLASHRVDHIYVEVNKPGAQELGLSETAALDLLNDAGYVVSRFDKRGNKQIEHWWASTPSATVG
jgi:FkbM family methyltransferase